MMDRSCGGCGKLRTPLCSKPDICVQNGYSNFDRLRPWKKCEKCGGDMRRIRTANPSKALVITDIVCSDCGLQAEEWREYRKKQTAQEGTK